MYLPIMDESGWNAGSLQAVLKMEEAASEVREMKSELPLDKYMDVRREVKALTDELTRPRSVLGARPVRREKSEDLKRVDETVSPALGGTKVDTFVWPLGLMLSRPTAARCWTACASGLI